MPFFEHLGELRKRLLISLVTVMVVFMATFNYSEQLFDGLLYPMKNDMSFQLKYPFMVSTAKSAEHHVAMVFLSPAEALWMHLKIAFIAAFGLALPVVLGQVWLFISPGLLANEKKYVLPFILLATMLFLAGASFCLFIVLPFALGFLMTYKTASLTPMISIGNYVDFTIKFILAFGAVFELPIVLVILTRMGVLTPKKLAEFRKYALVLAFVAAGILTPTPDAFNQMLMAVPIILLYEIGIVASRLFGKRRPAQEKDAAAQK